MTPSTAADSAIFRTYLLIVVVLLLVAGGTLLVVRFGLRRSVRHAWESFRGWLVMIPTVMMCVYLGREAAVLLITVVSLVAFWEYARATQLANDMWMFAAVCAGIVACGVAAYVNDPFSHKSGWFGLYMTLPVFVIALIMLIPVARNRARGETRNLALATLGYLYIGWGFCHLALLTTTQNPYGYLLFILFAVELTDVAAFTCGKMFGRHPLRSNISPNKTWEGSCGALAVAMLLPWMLRFSLEDFTLWERILTGIIVGIGGQLGDLSISVVKRDASIKDMGTIIRGHGGILDRIDSLVYSVPLFFHMVHFFNER